METLTNIVRELRIQDDLRCMAITEIAKERDIDYRQAEKIMDMECEKAEKITDQLLKEIAIC